MTPARVRRVDPEREAALATIETATRLGTTRRLRRAFADRLCRDAYCGRKRCGEACQGRVYRMGPRSRA